MAAPVSLLPVAIVIANILRFWMPRRLAEERARRVRDCGYLASGVITGISRPHAFDTSRYRLDVAVDWPLAARLQVVVFFIAFQRPPPVGTHVDILVDPTDWAAGYVGPPTAPA